MYDELYKMIMKVDFKHAKNVFLEMESKAQKEVMSELAYNTESMLIHAFIQYVNENDEKTLFHEIQFDMLTNALCHIEGAYQIALFHNM